MCNISYQEHQKMSNGKWQSESVLKYSLSFVYRAVMLIWEINISILFVIYTLEFKNCALFIYKVRWSQAYIEALF